MLNASAPSEHQRAVAVARAPFWLWFLVALLSLHWAAPLGQQAPSAATLRIAQDADGASTNRRTGEPGLQPRLLALAGTSELRAYAGNADPTLDGAPTAALCPAVLERAATASALTCGTRHETRPTRPRAHAYDARGPPRNA